jgi:integrase
MRVAFGPMDKTHWHGNRAVQAELRQQRANQIKNITFDQAAARYIAAHEAGWRSPEHTKQWVASLRLYVSPIIGSLDVQAIEVGHVMQCLAPIWTLIPETASRVRNRIELVLDWAKAHGLRDGENPARLRGHISHLLAPRNKVRAVKHYASMAYTDVGAFMASLREREGSAAKALQLIILCASRSAEVVNMRWGEVDLAGKVWTIPPERMKAQRPHRVPLSDQAVALIRSMETVRENEFVFPGQSKPALSRAAVDRLMRFRIKAGVCIHGFRATFRTWAAECTSFPKEIIEQCLAHKTGSAVELAYQRSDQLLQRRELMTMWAEYLQRPIGEEDNVISLRA